MDDKLIYPPMSSAIMGGTVTGKMWRAILLYAQDKLGEEERGDTPVGGRRNIEDPPVSEGSNVEPDGGLPVNVEPEPGHTPPADTKPRQEPEPEPQPQPEPEPQPDELPDGVPLPEGPAATSGDTVHVSTSRRAL